ncbi:tyrosine-type recombinase/integrase [Mycobacterium intracellulare]|uniref:tyrosine-type recombinase/integrase n=1 Tax=Mycobacterium intracellulare TaxID=1767 RepID=UPI003977AAFF
MGKRANGEGTVRQRPNGTWEARLHYDDPETGKRVRRSFYGRTAKAARDAMKAGRDRIDAGAPVKDAAITVADWLVRWRATTLAASDRSESTKALYGNLARKHLEPEPFGATRLDRLKATDVEALILRMRAKTKPGKAIEDDEEPQPVRALSDSTIRQAYTVLRAALDGAVRDGLLARNPAAAVKRPGVARREAQHLGGDDVLAVLAAAEGSRYYPVLALIAGTGLRRGEALALTWDRVDLTKGTVTVAATLGRVGNRLLISEPKSERSRRTVPVTPGMVALLRKQKATQAAEKLRAANQWRDRTGLVFTTELGAPVEPRNVLRVVETAARAAGVAEIGVHTLRHSAAVGMLESGVHIKQVADLLGHSSIAVTGDVYGHGSDDGARAAVTALAARIGL